MNRRFGAGRGFTLIELLVVITIIILILALFLPVLQKNREVMRRVLCSSNQHQIGLAIRMYADTNKGWMFTHWNSIGAPSTSPMWSDPGADPSGYQHVPYEKREAQPFASTSPGGYSEWPWDNLGGPKGSGSFYDGLYPNFLASGKVFNCPSARFYTWGDMGYYAGWEAATRFETWMGKYLDGDPATTSAQFWGSYTGNVFGRVDRPFKEYGRGFWSSYYIQGYYPYLPEYQSSVGALMWDVGSYAFTLGFTGTVTRGCHVVGGNELFIDGSVKWRNYPWMAGVAW